LSYVASWGVTSSGITISWSTDAPATTVILYGTTSALGQTTPLQAALSNSHGVTLSNLNAGNTYYFVAQSTGANGATGVSPISTFTTIATAGPAITAVTPMPQSSNQAQIAWTTSVRAYSYVTFGSTSSYGHWSSRTSLTAAPQVTLGWVPSGIVHYQIVSVDASGNQTISPDFTFVEP
jgi:hypothetical protein